MVESAMVRAARAHVSALVLLCGAACGAPSSPTDPPWPACTEAAQRPPAVEGPILRVEHHDMLPAAYRPEALVYTVDGRCAAVLSSRRLSDRLARVVFEHPQTQGAHVVILFARFRHRNSGYSYRVRSSYQIDLTGPTRLSASIESTGEGYIDPMWIRWTQGPTTE